MLLRTRRHDPRNPLLPDPPQILGEHALRYIAEHNPSQLRYADPSRSHRVETIAHELTDQERVQAANSDEYIRGQTGLLWGFNEFYALHARAPGGPVETTGCDELDELMAPYCALCEGSGMSHRTIRKHPRMRTGRSGSRAGTAVQRGSCLCGNTVSQERHHHRRHARVADQTNFTHALDWASEGYVDDDYLAPRSQFADYPSNPIMPDFGANMIRSYLSSGWRLNYDAHMRNPLAGLEPGIYRKWCVLNLLAMLDDRNFTAFPGFQTIMDSALNFVVGPGWVHNFNQLFFVDNAYTGTFGPSSFSQVLLNGAITNRDDVYLTDGADAATNGGPWVDTAERDRRLDLVDQILGDATARA